MPLARAEVEIVSNMAELAGLRVFVRTVCQGTFPLALDEDSTSQVELAVHETVSNIIQHAYHGHADQRIQVEVEKFADRLAIRLSHWGEAFNPGPVAPPSFDGSQERGLGLFLITQAMDEVRYSREACGKHCIYLVKHLPRTSEESAP